MKKLLDLARSFKTLCLALLLLLSFSCTHEKDDAYNKKADDSSIVGLWRASDGQSVVFNKDKSGKSQSDQFAYFAGGLILSDFQWDFNPVIGDVVLYYEDPLVTTRTKFDLISINKNKIVLKDPKGTTKVLTR